jgi:hypothetical protein
MAVSDLSSGNITAAWLYGFGVDKHFLLPSHKSWIELSLIPVMRAYAYTPTPVSWNIWCVGAASRTASLAHNARLSRRRADEARNYIHPRLAGLGGKCNVRSIGVSEIPAMIQGRPDEVEYLFDRGVLVVAERLTSESKKNTPTVAVPLDLMKKINVTFCIAGTRRNIPDIQIQNWDVWLIAIYQSPLENKKVGEYWPAFKRGVKIDLQDVVTKLIPIPPPITDASPQGFFAGYQTVAFPSVVSLSHLDMKEFSFGIRFGVLHIPIYRAMPDGSDLKLELDTTIGDELSQTYTWPPLGLRTQMNDTLRKLFEGWRLERSLGKKKWVRG